MLDTLIQFLDDNLAFVLKNISDFVKIFEFPLTKGNLTTTKVEKVCALFPPNQRPDECALQAQLRGPICHLFK